MSSLEKHCADCLEKLGEEYREVHRWLDGKAVVKGKYLDVNHRRHRHHEESLAYVEERWGEKAVEAARIHLIDDDGTVMTKSEAEEKYPDQPALVPLRYFELNDAGLAKARSLGAAGKSFAEHREKIAKAFGYLKWADVDKEMRQAALEAYEDALINFRDS